MMRRRNVKNAKERLLAQDEVMILRLQESLMMLEISSSLDFVQYI